MDGMSWTRKDIVVCGMAYSVVHPDQSEANDQLPWRGWSPSLHLGCLEVNGCETDGGPQYGGYGAERIPLDHPTRMSMTQRLVSFDRFIQCPAKLAGEFSVQGLSSFSKQHATVEGDGEEFCITPNTSFGCWRRISAIIVRNTGPYSTCRYRYLESVRCSGLRQISAASSSS